MALALWADPYKSRIRQLQAEVAALREFVEDSFCECFDEYGQLKARTCDRCQILGRKEDEPVRDFEKELSDLQLKFDNLRAFAHETVRACGVFDTPVTHRRPDWDEYKADAAMYLRTLRSLVESYGPIPEFKDAVV
jgi:hypothetical protein